MAKANQASFEELALPHLELCFRVAKRLTRADDAAEDLVQETMLKAYKAFDSFELREYGIKPWLLRIMHNTHLNQRTRAARAPVATDQANIEQQHAGTLNAEHADWLPALDFERLDAEVKAAIDALSSEFREVVLLWATAELSYKDIAAVLDVPMGTVMSRLHRGRQHLARSLQEYAKENRLVRDPESPRNAKK